MQNEYAYHIGIFSILCIASVDNPEQKIIEAAVVGQVSTCEFQHSSPGGLWGRMKCVLQMEAAGADTFHYRSVGNETPGMLPISGSSEDHNSTLPHYSCLSGSPA